MFFSVWSVAKSRGEALTNGGGIIRYDWFYPQKCDNFRQVGQMKKWKQKLVFHSFIIKTLPWKHRYFEIDIDIA